MFGSAWPWLIAGILFYVFDETIVSRLLGWGLLLLAAFLAGNTILRSVVTKRFLMQLYRNDSPGLTLLRTVTSRLFMTQRTATYTNVNNLLLFMGIPYLFIAMFLGLNWWSIPLALAAALFNVGWRQLNPPVAIFLSTSTPDQIGLCVDLQYRMFPLKLANMLSAEAIAALRGSPNRMLAAIDGNRLTASESWEAEVDLLMSCVPVIIIDLRSDSARLEAEYRMINARRLHWKVIAVHDDGVDTGALERSVFGNARMGDIAWMRPQDVSKAIVHSLIVQKRLPSKSQPAGRVLTIPDYDYGEWHLWQAHPMRIQQP